ncbi:ead/Ea22-like family protein [Pantoea sp. UYEF8]|uniref:ead/Ea22-like family protein n=1 Tax=Pantoea sp. UYEF8 TaxID=1756394 RepID=UPI00339403CF
MKDLDELVELAKKATPGKWWIDSHGHSMVAFSGEAGDVEIVFATDNDMGPLVRNEDTGNLSHWRNDNDATFIAATNPETILTLIARIKAQDEELLELRKGSFMPLRLTAENGAKAALMGEFTEETSIPCTECFGDDECENCDGSGRILVEVPVSWTTIKSIYAKAVEHFQNAAS